MLIGKWKSLIPGDLLRYIDDAFGRDCCSDAN